MSDKSSTKVDPSSLSAGVSNSSSPQAPCCAWKIAAALLLLRLCIGWHFFSEGTKKLSYDQGQNEWSLNFSAEPFFRMATGPFAGLIKSQLPGFYDWENLLAVPHQSVPLTTEQVEQQAGPVLEPGLRQDVARVLAELPTDQRVVLILRDLEGLSEAEAAAELNVARGTIKSRLHRAREAFRKRWPS